MINNYLGMKSKNNMLKIKKVVIKHNMKNDIKDDKIIIVTTPI